MRTTSIDVDEYGTYGQNARSQDTGNVKKPGDEFTESDAHKYAHNKKRQNNN